MSTVDTSPQLDPQMKELVKELVVETVESASGSGKLNWLTAGGSALSVALTIFLLQLVIADGKVQQDLSRKQTNTQRQVQDLREEIQKVHEEFKLSLRQLTSESNRKEAEHDLLHAKMDRRCEVQSDKLRDLESKLEFPARLFPGLLTRQEFLSELHREVTFLREWATVHFKPKEDSETRRYRNQFPPHPSGSK